MENYYQIILIKNNLDKNDNKKNNNANENIDEIFMDLLNKKKLFQMTF